MNGLGYGVQIAQGSALVEANIFDYTRHAVSGGGAPGEGYEAQYNIHLGNAIGQIFDVHGYTNPATGQLNAGNTYKIHHNTVIATTIGRSIGGEKPASVYIVFRDTFIDFLRSNH